MLDAMAGAGIHPDAEVPESIGTYGRISSAYVVGKGAADIANLPKKLHVKVTGQEYDTAQVIGDIGLILKDIGGVSVIGMMAFDEIFSCFEEGIIGSSSGASNSPLGHIGGYCVVALKAMIDGEMGHEEIGEKIVKSRMDCAMDEEGAILSINIIAHKSAEISRGEVTKCLIRATDPIKTKMIYERANYAFEHLKDGEKLEDIVRNLDDQRVKILKEGAGRIYSKKMGMPVSVKIRKIEKGARRSSKLARKYLAFDPLIDLDITIDGKTYSIDSFVNDFVPRICQGESQEYKEIIPPAIQIVKEISIAGYTILNVTVPSAVACAMGIETSEDAGIKAEKGGYITAGIPGGKGKRKGGR